MKDRFYGDPVEKFLAMANSTGGCDEAHFRMWCKIAADEIQLLRKKIKSVYFEGCSAGRFPRPDDKKAYDLLWNLSDAKKMTE